MRIAVPSKACEGVDIGGKRYDARGGFINVDNARDAKAITATGEFFLPSNVASKHIKGFICEDCGFHAVFRICSRCGGNCHRPGEQHG